MLWGQHPQQTKSVSSTTETEETTWPRVLGMGEVFCSQEKAGGPTPPRSARLFHQGSSSLSFSLALYMYAHDSFIPLFWEEQTLTSATLMMPDTVYEPSLPSPRDKPCTAYICHLDFIEDTQAVTRYGPRTNPPSGVLHLILNKRAQVRVLNPRD